MVVHRNGIHRFSNLCMVIMAPHWNICLDISMRTMLSMNV